MGKIMMFIGGPLIILALILFVFALSSNDFHTRDAFGDVAGKAFIGGFFLTFWGLVIYKLGQGFRGVNKALTDVVDEHIAEQKDKYTKPEMDPEHLRRPDDYK